LEEGKVFAAVVPAGEADEVLVVAGGDFGGRYGMPRITQASMLARSGTRGSIADTNDGSFRSTPAFGGGATRDRLVSANSGHPANYKHRP
jgi:hypothetical protein